MFRLTGLAILEHRAGNQAAAEKAFAQLVSEVGTRRCTSKPKCWPSGAARTRRSRSERARAIGDSGLSLVATDPLLDPIANDPRFRAWSIIGFRLTRLPGLRRSWDSRRSIRKEIRR